MVLLPLYFLCFLFGLCFSFSFELLALISLCFFLGRVSLVLSSLSLFGFMCSVSFLVVLFCCVNKSHIKKGGETFFFLEGGVEMIG